MRKEGLSIIDRSKLKLRDFMMDYGVKHGKIFPYPDELFDRLRPYNFGGFPASITLFVNEMCNGHCYDRARLMQLPFDDAVVVHADIESLRITAGKDYAGHGFVETGYFGGGRKWVIDTSIGLIYDKDYYYMMEKPKVKQVFTKEQCMQDPDIVEGLAINFDNDKYLLPLTMPMIESAIKNSNHIGTVLYRDKILKEIELFKKAVGYDAIRAEIDADLELLKSGPEGRKKIDARLGIVRDEYGREMSRNGVPNPYYYSIEDMKRMEEEYNEAMKDPKTAEEWINKMSTEVAEDVRTEYMEAKEIADRRLAVIKDNPTINYYELAD
ncbi:MAG: hypothetical protein E7361_02005 [Clostridiales bacterium]|nr:hypothetical protein [Clostridiales bacterium]